VVVVERHRVVHAERGGLRLHVRADVLEGELRRVHAHGGEAVLGCRLYRV